jgi:hypothetical protein
MPTYVSLLHFTQKGVESIKEGPARLDRAKQAFRAAGGELKAFYVVMGQYDAIAVSEMPTDEASPVWRWPTYRWGTSDRRLHGHSPRTNTGRSSRVCRELTVGMMS